MADTYLKLVNTGFTGELARKLGLPRPAVLRRYRPGEPLVPGPVLLLDGSSTGPEGTGRSSGTIASALAQWGLTVLRQDTPGEKTGAIVLVLDGLARPEDLSAAVLAAGAALRNLAPGGRVVMVSRPVEPEIAPAAAAARQGAQGLLRSLGRELRAGATANGILLGAGVGMDAPAALGALRFLLSGKSAYVSGQFLEVTSGAGSLPADWEKPLAGKVAVITGAARGIGAATAAVLHRDGADVVVVDVPAAGEQLSQVANRVHGTALQLDITAPDAGNRILEHALQRYGRLDIVVHNAGITRDKLLANMDEARWNAVIGVNIAAQLRINEVLLGSEEFRHGGRIVCLASTSGIAGNRGQTNYAASKAGVIGMVQASAPALAADGGSINAVAPGFIETDMTARMPLATREMARRLNSLQQGGLPQDVAETIAFLASDAAAGINGQTLRVCGQNLVGA